MKRLTHFIVNKIMRSFSWRERLQILLGGTLVVRVQTFLETEPQVKNTITETWVEK